jgi:aryl-alcohol dehydrogenase-like predicted oxidoreductase
MKKDDTQTPLDRATIKEIDKWFEHPVNRREFVRGGVFALAFSLGITPFSSAKAGVEHKAPVRNGKLPQVTFGGTGAKVSVLGIGTQTMGENQNGLDESSLKEQSIEVFNHAIDKGVTYFDTAAGYGRAEEFLGATLKDHLHNRERFFIVTKVWTNSYIGAKRAFERSLRRLGTDYVDLLHIHDAGMRDMNEVLKHPSEEGYDPNVHGAWKYLEEQKKAGRVRFLGVTAHSGPEQYEQLIKHTHDPANEREKVDATMVRFSYVSHNWHGFHTLIPPLVKDNNLGAMIMKVFGGPRGFGNDLNERELREAVRYARGYDWGHGCVIGSSSKIQIDQNSEWVQCTPMTPKEMEQLRSLTVASNNLWQKRFDRYVSAKYVNFDSIA